jgi:hypothetical protein
LGAEVFDAIALSLTVYGAVMVTVVARGARYRGFPGFGLPGRGR